MSLMRWLAACRSLKSVEDGPSRYKLTQQNLVPRFGPKTGKHAGIVKRVLGWLREWVIEPWEPVARRLRALCRPPRLLMGPKKRAKTPVQAELVLDTVRVMRNDLRDEDLLPVKKRGQPWSRVASRLFGPNQIVR
jgi:hypothetical protein